jgi:hypothetical protein
MTKWQTFEYTLDNKAADTEEEHKKSPGKTLQDVEVRGILNRILQSRLVSEYRLKYF